MIFYKRPFAHLISKEINFFYFQIRELCNHLNLIVGIMLYHLNLTIERRFGGKDGCNDAGEKYEQKNTSYVRTVLN